MMLYVFHVDVGRMMSFDMTVALSSVENLKETIERLHGIPAANIVLLVSGGDMLTESSQVSCYSAGTDNNPIYMFLTGDVKLPSTLPQTDTEIDLSDQVQRSMELPAVYETVVARAQLASKMYDLAREEQRLCERLVHDQHLQQQGWSAVVANMEDLTNEFRLRFHNFCTFFDHHLEKRDRYLELLHNFSADLSRLSRIPILPGLMPLAEADFHGFDEYLDNDDVFSRSHTEQESVIMPKTADADADTNASADSNQISTSPNKKPKISESEKENENANEKAKKKSGKSESSNVSTKSSSSAKTTAENILTHSGAIRRSTHNLLQWITSKENHNSLQTMSDECFQGLATFNEELYEKLKLEIQNIIKVAEQGEVKEIKGLSERLMRLEEFRYKVKDMVQDQKELSTAFQQNQSRAINLREPSILPDLCESHRSQLQVMLLNQKKINEHRRCISKAKDELGANLHTRLNRIVCIENAMSDYDNRLLFYHRCLRRAERHISIIEQIHQAPSIYVAAVTEVVRRKIFSEEFSCWATKLSEDFDALHGEEIKRRQTFNESFEGHFLNILFPGMNDMPPTIANENPLTFDARLPNLSKSDIEVLSSYLPELAEQIHLPDMRPVIRFFVSRSGEHQKDRWQKLLQEEAANLSSLQIQSTANVSLEKPQPQRLADLQKEELQKGIGCDDSETETEFEKVPLESGATSVTTLDPADPMPKSTQPTRCDLMISAETLTEDNEGTTREELQSLRTYLKLLSQQSIECIRLARSNLATARSDAVTQCEDLKSDIRTLKEACHDILSKSDLREKELLETQSTTAHENDELRLKLNNCELEIVKLKDEVQNAYLLQEKCSVLSAQLKEMREEFNAEKETAVALAREELIHEHKTEIESLRCRFKLMTSMERSPSDMSLEKIERPISRTSVAVGDETLCEMIDIKQHEAEKEKAINVAVEAERNLWQSKFTLNSESVMANVGILKVIEEKERQLEQLRERELMLTKENFQLKTRLDALTNEDANSWLKEKIEYMNRDKERLEKEVEKLKMEGSFAGVRGPLGDHNVLPRSKSSSSSHKYLVLQSVDKGDVVFVVWSTTYAQFIVVQDSQSLFFVHSDSLAGLKLSLPKLDGDATGGEQPVAMPVPMPYHAIGVVLDKEYCQARKDKNRYRVPFGSKFYRVKLAPITIAQPTARVPRERLESLSKSLSRSQSQCESQSEASSTTKAIVPVTISFVQTGNTSTDKDTLDAGAISTITTTSTGTTTATAPATTTTIVVSAAPEKVEDEFAISDRCRYVSASEEEELSVTSAASALQPQQQQSVITEQPTASNKIKLDLMLLPKPQHQQKQEKQEKQKHEEKDVDEEEEEGEVEGGEKEKEDSSKIMPDQETVDNLKLLFKKTEIDHEHVVIETDTTTTNAGTLTTSCVATPTTFMTSEDSDEYRSLEGKDDETEFGTFD